MSRFVRYGVHMPWHPEKIACASLGDAHKLAAAVNRARDINSWASVFQWYNHEHGEHKNLNLEEEIERHTKLRIVSRIKKPNPGKNSAQITKRDHNQHSTHLRSVK